MAAAKTPRKRPTGQSAAPAPSDAPKAARKLARGPLRPKKPPTGRVLRQTPDTVTLEEVMVNFQRSLARATRASLETARADMQVGMGQRALYVIDGIDVKLQVGVVMARGADGHIQAISVDFGADPAGPGQADLGFRIASRPIDPIATEQIVLADLDPLGLQRPSHRMRVTLIGHRLLSDDAVKPPRKVAPRRLESMARREPAAEANTTPAAPPRVLSPLPARTLYIYVVGTTTGRTELFEVDTNSVGQADVEIDALTNRITSGERGARFSELDLTRKDSEFFVWAACNPELAKDGITSSLTSNVLQFTVSREASQGT